MTNGELLRLLHREDLNAPVVVGVHVFDRLDLIPVHHIRVISHAGFPDVLLLEGERGFSKETLDSAKRLLANTDANLKKPSAEVLLLLIDELPEVATPQRARKLIQELEAEGI